MKNTKNIMKKIYNTIIWLSEKMDISPEDMTIWIQFYGALVLGSIITAIFSHYLMKTM